jgi:hypothetical protein
VGSKSKAECHGPSDALRLRSVARLRADLNQYLVASEPDVELDWRDVLVGLALNYDCAQRLGVDPVELFASASADLGDRTQELARSFAHRFDITLEAFGWTLVAGSHGPCYQPIGPPRRQPPIA